jgi:predicted acyltransferase
MASKDRLYSLDLLRGIDMIFLTVVGPLLLAANEGWKCLPDGVIRQLNHGWECFTLWDLIMPLFVFMCGAAIPFALDRRLEEGKKVFWRHVLSRFALLWVLGCLVQGRLATLDPLKISPYSNTLQAIAAGYLAVAAAMSAGSRRLMVAAPVVLAAGYTLLLAFFGDYSQYGNFAFKVDRAILTSILPAGNSFVKNPSHYTWFLTSMMFAAMTFAGYFATRILLRPDGKISRFWHLVSYAAALLAVGFGSQPWIPCIKPIFTLSFTAQAMGWSVLLLAALYLLADVYRVRRGSGWVIFFGRNALAAYFVSHFFRTVLGAFAHLAGDGLLAYLPAASHPLVLRSLMIFAMIACMRAKLSFKR